MTRVSIAAKTRENPPHWAVRQRDLIALMDRAARPLCRTQYPSRWYPDPAHGVDQHGRHRQWL